MNKMAIFTGVLLLGIILIIISLNWNVEKTNEKVNHPSGVIYNISENEGGDVKPEPSGAIIANQGGNVGTPSPKIISYSNDHCNSDADCTMSLSCCSAFAQNKSKPIFMPSCAPEMYGACPNKPNFYPKCIENRCVVIVNN